MLEKCADAVFQVLEPELFGRISLLFPEYPVEVGDVVEAAVVGDFRDGMRGIDQHAAGMADADIGEAVDKPGSRFLLEKAAESHFRFSRQAGYIPIEKQGKLPVRWQNDTMLYAG